MWHLQSNKEARKVFIRDDAEILTNTNNWQDVKIKDLLNE